MNAAGAVLMIFGVWVLTQVLAGDALARLGIVPVHVLGDEEGG